MKNDTTLYIKKAPASATRMLGRMRTKHISLLTDGEEGCYASLWRAVTSKAQNSGSTTYRHFYEKDLHKTLTHLTALYMHAREKEYDNDFLISINNLKDSSENSVKVTTSLINFFKPFTHIEYDNGQKKSVISISNFTSKMSINTLKEKMTIEQIIRFDSKNNDDRKLDLAKGLIGKLRQAKDPLTVMGTHYNQAASITSPFIFEFEAHMTIIITAIAIGMHEPAYRYFADTFTPFIKQEGKEQLVTNLLSRNKTLGKDFLYDMLIEINSHYDDAIEKVETNIFYAFANYFIEKQDHNMIRELLSSIIDIKNSAGDKLDFRAGKEPIHWILKVIEEYRFPENASAIIFDYDLQSELILKLLDIDTDIPISAQTDKESAFVALMKIKNATLTEKADINELFVAFLDKFNLIEFEQARFSHPAYSALTNNENTLLNSYHSKRTLMSMSAEDALFAVISTSLLTAWLKAYKKTPNDALSMNTLSPYMKVIVLQAMIK